MFTETAAWYDAIYHFKDYAFESKRVADCIRQAHPGSRSVLDVGCGTGEHLRWLSRHDFDVSGLDRDEALLAIAKQKNPAVEFFCADMGGFELGRRYDAIVCLFSSIAYLVTLDRVRAALQCFRRHLTTSGALIVEPWFEPGVMNPDRSACHDGQVGDVRVERRARIDIDGRISRLHFDYLIQSPTEVHHAHELHELGLFTTDEMRDAFEQAGFVMHFEPNGLIGRGLWTGHVAV